MSTTPSSWRSFFRVPLRSLLVLMAVICMGFALGKITAERQRTAVEVLRKAGARVSYAGTAWPEEDSVVRKIFPRDHFDRVESVEFGAPNEGEVRHQLGKKELDAIASLSALKTLDLSGTGIRDSDVWSISGHAMLETLILDDTELSMAGLSKLKNLPELREMSISTSSTSEECAASLAGLKKLKTIHVKRP